MITINNEIKKSSKKPKSLIEALQNMQLQQIPY